MTEIKIGELYSMSKRVDNTPIYLCLEHIDPLSAHSYVKLLNIKQLKTITIRLETAQTMLFSVNKNDEYLF